jgi:hypothetical protein
MRWTVMSTDGQTLRAETLENGDVNMSSKAGNHGQYTRAQWDASLAKMIAAGYNVKIED